MTDVMEDSRMQKSLFGSGDCICHWAYFSASDSLEQNIILLLMQLRAANYENFYAKILLSSYCLVIILLSVTKNLTGSHFQSFHSLNLAFTYRSSTANIINDECKFLISVVHGYNSFT